MIVSLTRHLSDPKSAVRVWFARRLPHTKPLVSEANRALRTPGTSTSAVVASGVLDSGPALPATANDQRLVGTTLDLLVRTTLADEGWSAAPTRGALRIAAEGAAEAIMIASEISDRLRRLTPAWLTPTAPEWREVAALCVLLARFEQAGRSHHATLWVVERLHSVAPTIDAYAVALVDQRDVADTAAAAPAVAADHADLRLAQPLLLGPTFALSGALGGADADLIAGGLLLDLKAAATTRIVRGEGLWQLAGYALADTHDSFTLRDVGISALRWRSRWVITLDELLSRLAGQSVGTSDLRHEFAEVATAAPLEA